MPQYLLSTYMVEGEVRGGPGSPEEMRTFMERVVALEAEMDEDGAFVFGGALAEPETAKVVSSSSELSDGAYATGKEQIAGFYIINADDDEKAQAWAEKTAAATQHDIEVRPFRATGRVADHMKGN